MQGIKPHVHQDREKIIQRLIPILQEMFGDNFIALAADGSYARNEDLDYSDLELIAFFNEIPREWSYRKIVDGMLIVVVSETKENYIEKYLNISDVWYASGAGKLLPIINEEFINEINSFIPENVEDKCLKQIQNRWPFLQEITAKVLNTALMKDEEAMPLIFSSFIKELLIVMAYLNSTPYVTLSSYISQAKQFTLKPEKFDELLGIFTTGNFQDVKKINNLTEVVFADVEKILEAKGNSLYKNKL